MKEKRRRNKINILLLIISLILIVFSIWLWVSRPLEVQYLDVDFRVGKNIGLTVDTDKLYFGRTNPGGGAERKINLENDYDFPLEVKLSVTKNIAGYIILYEDYTIPAKNKTQIPIGLKIPRDTPYGNYTGKIKFEFRRA